MNKWIGSYYVSERGKELAAIIPLEEGVYSVWIHPPFFNMKFGSVQDAKKATEDYYSRNWLGRIIWLLTW